MDALARFLPLRDYERLKQAWRELVRACGGAEKVALLSRAKCKSHLSEFGSPHCLDRFPPLDVIADCEAECGDPIVTRAMAELAFCSLVSRETPRVDESHLSRFAALAHAFGKIAETYAAALRDNDVDETERAALRPLIRHMTERLREIDASLDVRPTLRAAS